MTQIFSLTVKCGYVLSSIDYSDVESKWRQRLGMDENRPNPCPSPFEEMRQVRGSGGRVTLAAMSST